METTAEFRSRASPPAQRRRGRTITLLVLGALLCTTHHISAHSFVERTVPKHKSTVTKPPARVLIEFNEAVELAFGAIEVRSPDGARVDQGDAEHETRAPETVVVGLADGLANGRYEVRWRVIAADGHPRKGTFYFGLDAPVEESPAGVPSPAETAAPGQQPGDEVRGTQVEREPAGAGLLPAFLLGVSRWFILALIIALVGLVIFGALVWRRPKGTFVERTPEVERAFTERWGRLARIAWLTSAIATGASIFLQGAVAAEVPVSGVSLGIAGDVLGTRFGRVALLRLALLAGAAVVWRLAGTRTLVAPTRVPAAVGPGAAAAPAVLSPRVAVSSAVICLGLLSTIGLAGHAGTTSPWPVNLPADLFHVAAAAAWLGGLVTMVGVAFPATRSLDDADRVCVLAPVVARFSQLAVVSVGVIAATGLIRSWVEVQSLSGLTTSDYGLTLLAKLAVFVPVLALGALNNRVTLPRCEMAARAHTATPALRTLRRLVLVEILLGAAIIGVTAFLVNLEPPRLEAMGAGHG